MKTRLVAIRIVSVDIFYLGSMIPVQYALVCYNFTSCAYEKSKSNLVIPFPYSP